MPEAIGTPFHCDGALRRCSCNQMVMLDATLQLLGLLGGQQTGSALSRNSREACGRCSYFPAFFEDGACASAEVALQDVAEGCISAAARLILHRPLS